MPVTPAFGRPRQYSTSLRSAGPHSKILSERETKCLGRVGVTPQRGKEAAEEQERASAAVHGGVNVTAFKCIYCNEAGTWELSPR